MNLKIICIHICSLPLLVFNDVLKTQDEEQEDECLTEESSEEEEEKNDESEKESKRSENSKGEDHKEEDSDEEEEEESEEEETVTEEDDDDAETDEDKQDDVAKPEPLGDSVHEVKPTLLRPQKVEPVRVTPPPPPVDLITSGNPTVVEDALQRILSDDSELTEVNLNNIDDITQVTTCFVCLVFPPLSVSALSIQMFRNIPSFHFLCFQGDRNFII